MMALLPYLEPAPVSNVVLAQLDILAAASGGTMLSKYLLDGITRICAP